MIHYQYFVQYSWGDPWNPWALIPDYQCRFHRIYQCYDCLHFLTQSINAMTAYISINAMTAYISINATTAYIFSQNRLLTYLSMLRLLTFSHRIDCLHIYQCYDCLHFLPVGRIQITGCFARPPPVSECSRTGSHLMWSWPQWSSFLEWQAGPRRW